MDTDIMVPGTVQTDCQVCQCHREFLDARFSPFMALVFPFILLPSNVEKGAELLLGQALPRMGVNFHLAGGAKGASSRRTAKMKLVLPFSHSGQKFRRRPATICIVSCSILILV